LKDEKISVGGQAVIEGVMMRSPKVVATVVRRADGTLENKVQDFIPLSKRKKYLNIPVLRGALSLFEMMKLGIGTLNWSADKAIEDEKKAKGEKVEKSKNTLNLSIEFPKNSANNVKIDLIRYAYPLLKPVAEIDGIRLLEIEDIIPMKLSAVAARGSKKDFYDIYFLLKQYTLDEMFGFFDRKFDNMNKFHIIKSLTYFDDADKETDPKTTEKITWKKIKQAILREVK